ncbi:MAG: alkaline phosphatase [Oceanicaulis sp.]
MTFRALLAAASGLSLAACANMASLGGAPSGAPEARNAAPAPAAVYTPADHDGPGADWRAVADAELADRLNRPQREGRAKNVILFVADGLSVGTITAARILDGQLRGETGEENYLPFERWGHTALIKTYNENAQVPDSAGTASALHTGVKTHVGAISVYARDGVEACRPGHPVPATILERAEDRGMATGLVATARLTHATPATAYAHLTSRNWEVDAVLPPEAVAAGCRDLARQLIEFDRGDGIELALGGGRAAFLTSDQGGQRTDGRDLTAEFAARGDYVADLSGFRALDPASERPVLGLFAPSHLAYAHDRDPEAEPSLEEMTAFAIDKLSRDEDGFYLLVEAGRVDHAHHGTNAHRALTDALAFAQAVERAAAMTDPDETLIIVTADHGHVFTIAGYPRRGNPILGLVHPPAPDLSDSPTPPSPAQDGRPYTTLGYYTGPVRRPVDGDSLTQDQVLDPDYRQQAAVPMGSETHSGEDVAAFARGPWAHLVDGVMEQHTLNRIMTWALGWESVDEFPEE